MYFKENNLLMAWWWANRPFLFRYNEAVKLARDPDVQNEALIQTFQRSYAGARKVGSRVNARKPLTGRALISPRYLVVRVEGVVQIQYPKTVDQATILIGQNSCNKRQNKQLISHRASYSAQSKRVYSLVSHFFFPCERRGTVVLIMASLSHELRGFSCQQTAHCVYTDSSAHVFGSFACEIIPHNSHQLDPRQRKKRVKKTRLGAIRKIRPSPYLFLAYTASCLGEKKHAPHLLRRSGETKDPSAGNRAPNRFDNFDGVICDWAIVVLVLS